MKIKLLCDGGFTLSFKGLTLPIIVEARKRGDGYEVMGSELIKAGTKSDVASDVAYLFLPSECEVINENLST